MGANILEFVKEIVKDFDVAAENEELVSRIILGVLVVVISLISMYITQWIINSPLRKLSEKTAITWDDKLFEKKLPERVSYIVPAVVIYLMLPAVLPHTLFIYAFCAKMSVLYIIAEVMRTLSGVISVTYDVVSESEKFRNRSLKGIFQVLQLMMVFVGILVMIAVLIEKPIGTMIAGLGASAAILTFIFKDSFVGLLAGLQLSYNDMLRPGDWITVPGKNVDGDVIEVTLNTVKVRNFDNTIVTIPPLTLINDSFQNWRGMSESAGRRIKRSIDIDLYSIEFASPQTISRLSEKYEVIEKYVSNRPETDVERGELTNIKLFRVYLEEYLRSLSDTSKSSLKMVRYLQPTSEGMPLELYFFSSNKNWVFYENFASDVMDHVIAKMPDFDLKPYQRVSGIDNRKVNLKSASK